MKKFGFFVLLLSTATAAFSTDLTIQANSSNLFWAAARTNDVAGTTFAGADFFYGLDAYIAQDLGENLKLKAGMIDDQIIHRKIFSEISYAYSNFTITVGPFFSTIATAEKWFSPGILAAFQYDIPGYLFARVGFQTSMNPLGRNGDFALADQWATVGIFLPNGIISGTIQDRSFQNRKSATITTIDSRSDYVLSTEVFEKNFPIRYALDIKYQILSRVYQASTTTSTPLNSALLGNRITWDIDQNWTVAAGFDFNILTFATDDTNFTVGANTFLYGASLTVRKTL